MISDDVLVLFFDGAERRWPQVVGPVVEARVADPPVHLKPIPAGQLIEHLDPDDPPLAAWVFAEPSTPVIDLYQALDQLSALHLPILLSRPNESVAIGEVFTPGVMIAPPAAGVEPLGLLFQAAVAQGETVRTLKQELRITRLHHGGLRGQIDKLDEEMRLAAQVQREFLPTHLPSVGEVDVQAMFRPASYVSGDIYHAERLDENHVGFWLADVVGHGVPAALMTMFVKRALPTKDILTDGYRLVPPHEALRRLNTEMVSRDGAGARFATAVYGVLNCHNLELQLGCAGHPPPLLMRAYGPSEKLDAHGPLLGVFEDEEFHLGRYQMHPGDRLLLYSDGFEAAFDPGTTDDPSAYLREFESLRGGTGEDAVWRLLGKLDARPGSLHQQDDLTVVMVSVGPPLPIEPAAQTPRAIPVQPMVE